MKYPMLRNVSEIELMIFEKFQQFGDISQEKGSMKTVCGHILPLTLLI